MNFPNYKDSKCVMLYPTTWQILFSSLVFKKLIIQLWKDAKAPCSNPYHFTVKKLDLILFEHGKDNNGGQHKKKKIFHVWSLVLSVTPTKQELGLFSKSYDFLIILFLLLSHIIK